MPGSRDRCVMIPDLLALSQADPIHTAWHLSDEGLIPKTCEGAEPARSSAWDPENWGRLVH